MFKLKYTGNNPGCLIFMFILWAYTIFAWFYNAYKLIMCDWTGPWRDEVVHAIGVVIPPASWLTVWF